MRLRLLLSFAILVLAHEPLRADQVPPIAPAYLEQELLAIGQVTSRRPAPGATSGGGGCSGTLIAPHLVLTAAHCVHHRVTQPQELFITFGWSASGPPTWRGTASRIILHPEYVPNQFVFETLNVDVALIVLPRPVPDALVTPLPLRAGLIAESYANYGFLAGRELLLRGNEGCQVALVARNVLGFDCDVVSGFSGGPLLAMTPDGPVVAAVAVAQAPGVRDGIRSFAAIPEPRLFESEPDY